MDKRLQECLDNTQFDYMAPFLWLHGESEELYISELHRIYESGIRSVCLESRTHEDFCREGWWKDVRRILDECKKLGMKLWILDDKHFPSGYANGIFVEKYKDLQPFGITEYHADVPGPVESGAVLAEHWVKPGEELLAVLACRHVPDSPLFTGEVLDITSGLSDGMVYFDLPEGLWRIAFLVKTRAGIAPYARCYSDKLNPEATRLYIEEVFESHYAHFKEDFGDTFLGFFADEPCFHNNTAISGDVDLGQPFLHLPWHQNVAEKLREAYGDGFYTKLPGLWFDFDNGLSQQIRLKYMDIVSRAFEEYYSRPVGQWCREHGVMFIGHIIEDNHRHAGTGYGPGHYFRAIGPMDMAGIDVVLHQIMPGLTECSNAGYVSYKHMLYNFANYYLAKLASSLAHFDPAKKGRAMCEIFGAYGWGEGTKMMKYLADHMLVRGINYFVPHAFSPKPDDPDCPPNFYDSGKNPQYPYFKDIMDYMNRCCHLLSDGEAEISCALLYDAEAHWMQTDFTPLEDCAKALYDHQIDYDIVPQDVLMELKGKYSLLIVPWPGCLMPHLEEKLQASGLRFVYAAKKGTDTGGRPSVSVEDLPAYFAQLGKRDVVCDREVPALKYRHYKRGGAHIYMFVSEDIHQPISVNVTLSAFAGGTYTEYDPMHNVAVKKTAEKEVPIVLEPYHSVMLFFGSFAGKAQEAKEIAVTEEIPLAPVFDIFVKKPEEEEYSFYKTTDTLFNITASDALPRFSGNMQYKASFRLEEAGAFLLNLGRVGETALVEVNGIPVGKAILPPYEFDISGAVRPGENTLCVTVSNTNVFRVRDEFSKYLLIEPSGLLGPLTLKKYRKQEE